MFKKTIIGMFVFSILGCAYVMANTRPNIVYFFADDLGWAGIRANQKIAAEQGVDINEISKVITPNIDWLVEGGINFTHAYSNPVCSPSRSSQQTGFHQGHTWADWNDPADDKAMRTQDPTIGKILASAGYRNGMYGKWGYGATKDLKNPRIVNEQTLPINHGYHDCVVELHHVRAHTFLQPSLWYSHVGVDGTVELETTLIDNRKMFPNVDLYADNYYAAGAIKFIREEAKGDSPFFVQVSFQVPHSPFKDIETIPGWFDDYQDVDTSTWSPDTKQYAAMLTLMDKRIGDIMAALRDPDNDGDESDSVLKHTLVIFSSDNGGAGNKPLKFFNGNGHLSNYKGSAHEGGIRDPLAFYWEGVIAPGQTTDYKTCITDIFPTFCELAGVSAPTGLDGISIAPLITGKGQQRKRPYFCYETPGSKRNWIWAIIKDNMKLGKSKDGTLFLYDLANDESEQVNLADNTNYVDVLFELLEIAADENLEADNLYANVFPTWIGEDGANVNCATSWKETGTWEFQRKWQQSRTPTSNWIAVVQNDKDKPQSAYLDTSINTLGFEVAGNAVTGAEMELNVLWDTRLVGRNEIRLAPYSIVNLDGATLESVRWVDIQEEAILRGSGQINASLYNAGVVDLATLKLAKKRQQAGSLVITGDFSQTEKGVLKVMLGKQNPMLVRDNASLNGQLKLELPRGFKGKKGTRYPILRSRSIQGAFQNTHGLVMGGGYQFEIIQNTNSVDVEIIAVSL